MAFLASVPRTLRTLQWAVQAAINYKQLLSTLDPDVNPEAYVAQLSRLHDVWAQVGRRTSLLVVSAVMVCDSMTSQRSVLYWCVLEVLHCVSDHGSCNHGFSQSLV